MVIGWVFLIIALVLILMFLKFRHLKHRFFAITVLLLLIFFYSTLNKSIQNHEIDFKSFNGWVTAGKIYISWLGHAIYNIKDLAGNAIKMDWNGNFTK